MPIKVRCKQCETSLKIPEAAMGKVVKCPKCATKLKIPAKKGATAPSGSGKGAPAAKRRKPAQRSPKSSADSSDFISALGNMALEDTQGQVCPKCGQDVDPELNECLTCGIDMETGQLTKERQREMSMKGPDSREFYKHLAADFFKFPFQHITVVLMAGFMTAFAYSLFAFGRFFIYASDGLTVEAFMIFVASLGIALTIGWIWNIATEFIVYTFQAEASRKKKRKIKPFKMKRLDLFLCFQNGYKFVAWALSCIFVFGVALSPVIIIMLLISVMNTGSFTPPWMQTTLGIIGGFFALLTCLFLPSAMGHMAMPISWPGWNPFKLSQLLWRTLGASLTWTLIALIFLAVPVGAYVVTYQQYKSDMDEVFDLVAYNASVTQAKNYTVTTKEGMPPEIKKLAGSSYKENIDYLTFLQSEGILILVASLFGMACVGSARALGHFVYYNQNSLELIREIPDRTYQVYDRNKYLPTSYKTQAGVVFLITHLLFGMYIAFSLLGAFVSGEGVGGVFTAAGVLYFVSVIPNTAALDGLCRIFEKAKKPGLASVVPIYNTYLICEIATVPMYMFALTFIPFVNFGAWIYICIKLAERFEKPVSFGLAMAILPPVFFVILGRSPDRALRLPTDPPPEYDDDDA